LRVIVFVRSNLVKVFGFLCSANPGGGWSTMPALALSIKGGHHAGMVFAKTSSSVIKKTEKMKEKLNPILPILTDIKMNW
jgi:hypothetical protein